MGITNIALVVCCIAIFSYTVYGITWRLYLSPIAKIPGSKLAAATFWYEFYFDVVKGGQYVFEIERMHELHGPIIRINPYEIHINDTDRDFREKLYPFTGTDVDKFWWSAGMFGSTIAALGTVGHNLHKLRRSAFSKFFSSAYLRRLEPIIRSRVDSIVSKITEQLHAGKTVNLDYAHAALTRDIITEYCFSSSRHCLEQPDFASHYYDWAQLHCTFSPLMKQFPSLLTLIRMLPDWFVRCTDEAVWAIREQDAEYRQQVRAVMTGGAADKTKYATIFHEILNDPSLPQSEKTEERLTDEATSLIGAGTLSASHILSLTTFNILSDVDILRKLCDELETAIPDPTSLPSEAELESLPYLKAVINEGLRLSYGTMHRLARCHPNNSLVYTNQTSGKVYVIPPGTPVGYSNYFLHRDPITFPDPEIFKPERWLIPQAEQQRLEACLNTFGRGTRQCVAINLAYTELYLTITGVFRRLGREMVLHETVFERDVKGVRDYFLPMISKEGKGVRVRAKVLQDGK